MRRLLFLFVVYAFLPGPVRADDDTLQIPRPPKVVKPIPMPKDDADPTLTIQPGDWLVIQAKEPIKIVLSPSSIGVVTDERATADPAKPRIGPINFSGYFADPKVPGSRAVERRPYDWDTIYSVQGATLDAAASGEIITIKLKSGDVTRTPITVLPSGSSPTPPGPGPAPGVDPLTTAVKLAYQTDATLTKVADMAALQAMYESGMAAAATADTWGTLALMMDGSKVTGKILGVRRAIKADLDAKLPGPATNAAWDKVQLTDDGRQLAKQQFGRVLTAIKEAQK